MANPRFSETQFVFGYLFERFNLMKRFGLGYYVPFVFPSTRQEIDFAADFIQFTPSHFELWQFKRSEYLGRRRGKREIAAGVPKSFVPYHRFEIYNSAKSQQFDRLRYYAQNPIIRCYYCAPKFHTHLEFHRYFTSQQICINSARIDCQQFSDPQFLPPSFDINDGDKHYITYNSQSLFGYICSKAQEIKIDFVSDNEKFFDTDSSKARSFEEFQELVRDIVFRLVSESEEADDMKAYIDYPRQSFTDQIKFISDLLLTKYDIVTTLVMKPKTEK